MGVEIRVADQPGDLGWMVWQHGEVYAEQFGWDTSFEAMVAGVVADYARARDERARGWVAEVDGRRVGCILCVPLPEDPHTAQLRILLVTPDGRGLGAGTALVDECVTFARAAGYEAMTLFTTANLASARRIYQAVGFRLVDEEPQQRFGTDIVGQNWRLELASGASEPVPGGREDPRHGVPVEGADG
jgi:GNAT superfamily N-acetyltransferase